MVIPVPVPAVPVSLLPIGFWEFVLKSVTYFDEGCLSCRLMRLTIQMMVLEIRFYTFIKCHQVNFLRRRGCKKQAEKDDRDQWQCDRDSADLHLHVWSVLSLRSHCGPILGISEGRTCRPSAIKENQPLPGKIMFWSLLVGVKQWNRQEMIVINLGIC